MGNQTYGYARVSTEQQNLDRQIDALTGYGVDRLYNEKMTGTRKDRPELRKMLESLTEGDTVPASSISISDPNVPPLCTVAVILPSEYSDSNSANLFSPRSHG